jgi:hypothetical protein
MMNIDIFKFIYISTRPRNSLKMERAVRPLRHSADALRGQRRRATGTAVSTAVPTAIPDTQCYWTPRRSVPSDFAFSRRSDCSHSEKMSRLPPIASQKEDGGFVRPARLHARAGSTMVGARSTQVPVEGQHKLNPHTLLQVTELVQSDLPAPQIIVRRVCV